jgi:hypothetical protein
MKSSKIFAGVAVAFLNVALCTVAVGQDNATAQEVIAKVREAASALSKTGDLAQFNQKHRSVGVERHLYLHPGLQQEDHGGSPHQAGDDRPRSLLG